MTFDIYKLTFHSPLHISRGKLNSYESSDSTVHSDTLKAALFVTAKQLYGVATAKDLHDNALISSAFPFDTEGCWLPRPVGYSFGTMETPDNRKDLKAVQFFTVSQFNHILKGELPNLLYKNDESQTRSKCPQPIIQNNKPYQPNIWKRDTTQRVLVNYDKDSEPFYLEKLYPVSESKGLYFIVMRDQDYIFEEKKFEAALRLLGDNGLGLQRGLGNGHFSFEKSTLTLDLPLNATNWIALSLYRPKDDAEVTPFLDKSQYQFIKRGGWLNSPEQDNHITIRKQSIMMFTEGSVFAFGTMNKSITVKGSIEDIAPKTLPVNKLPLTHEVFRDGRAIFLPISI